MSSLTTSSSFTRHNLRTLRVLRAARNTRQNLSAYPVGKSVNSPDIFSKGSLQGEYKTTLLLYGSWDGVFQSKSSDQKTNSFQGVKQTLSSFFKTHAPNHNVTLSIRQGVVAGRVHLHRFVHQTNYSSLHTLLQGRRVEREVTLEPKSLEQSNQKELATFLTQFILLIQDRKNNKGSRSFLQRTPRLLLTLSFSKEHSPSWDLGSLGLKEPKVFRPMGGILKDKESKEGEEVSGTQSSCSIFTFPKGYSPSWDLGSLGLKEPKVFRPMGGIPSLSSGIKRSKGDFANVNSKTESLSYLLTLPQSLVRRSRTVREGAQRGLLTTESSPVSTILALNQRLIHTLSGKQSLRFDLPFEILFDILIGKFLDLLVFPKGYPPLS